ncbi:PDZ domain-containing protein 8 isoform X1 [Neodiprion virginianus]|uniref:PDZ domain-containing protein 8 isoform X1 n=1 Tax=Neodiprion virginianus TaxID=2961670 RepID=UPI001EE6FE90|nr:PDZ domain-containing protein 8 isoform X1 [Neodiprion virginianus]
MDFWSIVTLLILSFICGVISTLALQWYIFIKYLEAAPLADPPEKPAPHGRAVLPDELLNEVENEKSNFHNSSFTPRQSVSQGNENLAINLTLQFLFNELRSAERVRSWLYRKLNNEFKVLLTRSTTGKLFDSVQLRDLHLGNQFPTIKGLEVADAKIDADTGLLETLDLALDLHYCGNFQLSIDAKMVLGKTAYLSVQVKRVTGRARLQFTRVPYTHWSLSFYSEPILEFHVQSHFQGRQLQPQIISLITGQIRRAIRKKHTLPRYKMRYKPFFRRLNDEDVDLIEDSNRKSSPGNLEVTLLEVSRLNMNPNSFNTDEIDRIEIYCTMSVDVMPWVCLTQYSGVAYMILDLIISKTPQQQLGVVFRQDIIPEIGINCVIVETIVSGSPAAIGEMRRGDILIAVDGKKVLNMNQVAKLVKGAAQRRFIIRVERKYAKSEMERQGSVKSELEKTVLDKIGVEKKVAKNEVSKSELIASEKSTSDMKTTKFDTPIKFSELKETDFEVLDFGEASKLSKRKESATQSCEDIPQTPSCPESPSRRISTISTISNQSLITNISQIYSTDDGSVQSMTDLYYTTKEKSVASLISFEETHNFQIDSDLQYLNLGVWARVKGGDNPPLLLGYINAPIKLILAQCSMSTIGHYLKCYALLPPDTGSTMTSNLKLQGYSGFDPTLCYGDVLLSFTWNISQVQNQLNAGETGRKENPEIARTPQMIHVESGDKKLHDFIRTHFHRATHCDFCSKKIWLKDAVQCRDCGLVCHKKCETRCQTSGGCGADSLTTLAFEADENESNIVVGDGGPEISFTVCEDQVQGAGMLAVKASIANTLFGLKRAGSATCLAPPSSGSGLASRSLPPSPCSSRKSSIVGGLGISTNLLEGADPSIVGPLLSGDLDDGLMSRAKDTGKCLYAYLEPEERVEKINSMMGKLKTALDIETTSRLKLSHSGEADSAKLIAQSDSRVQALSVLLLHYCAGLQHAQEAMDRREVEKDL